MYVLPLTVTSGLALEPTGASVEPNLPDTLSKSPETFENSGLLSASLLPAKLLSVSFWSSFLLSLTPPAKAPAIATSIDWVYVSDKTFKSLVTFTIAPSAMLAFTSLSNWLTLTDAPTAPPEEDVEPEPSVPEAFALSEAIAPAISILDMPSFIVDASFNTSKPVSESTPI